MSITGTAWKVGRRARDGLREATVPPGLRRKQRNPSEEQMAALAASLERNFFEPRFGPDYLRTAEGQADLHGHLRLQLGAVRRRAAPWLNSLSPLDHSEVVEIGCSTGNSTVAFAEQGAHVVAFDVDVGSLRVAKDRCAAYRVTADLREGNAADLPAEVVARSDLVVFTASLEHMTLDERLAALANTWACLKPGAWMVVVETPNRLWWFDDHTSFLPFYLWLPEDLAIHYATYSDRWPFNAEVAPPTDDAMRLRLARIGRCASYHEFQLAIGDLSGLEIRGLGDWNRRNPVHWVKWMMYDRAFHRTLARLGPSGVSRVFYEPYLELAIHKP